MNILQELHKRAEEIQAEADRAGTSILDPTLSIIVPGLEPDGRVARFHWTDDDGPTGFIEGMRRDGTLKTVLQGSLSKPSD